MYIDVWVIKKKMGKKYPLYINSTCRRQRIKTKKVTTSMKYMYANVQVIKYLQACLRI